MLYKTYTYKLRTTAISLIIIALLLSCQFNPVYMSGNASDKLCSIKVADEKRSAGLFELNFKNELIYILCDNNVRSPDYILRWNIKKSFRELIKSESTNTARRYEETLLINFSIYNIESKTTVFSDFVTSKGAYNILEDQVTSTLASKIATESQIAIIAARLTLDKIQLFMLKDENSKF